MDDDKMEKVFDAVEQIVGNLEECEGFYTTLIMALVTYLIRNQKTKLIHATADLFRKMSEGEVPTVTGMH